MSKIAEDIQIKKTACAICSTCCPVDAFVKDGKMLSVEGSMDAPGCNGTICAKGAAAPQFVYNKERLLYPMKRIGERGSGEFERITWEEAYQMIREKLLGIKENYGARSTVFYTGYPKWYRPAFLRLSNGYGSPNYCSESSVCYQAVVLAWRIMYGNDLAYPDLRNARTVLFWSANMYYSNAPKSDVIRNLKKQGKKLIVVDPRKSPTALDADIHLQLLPGTDGALALSMAHVIIEEGLYDREFVEQYTYGFEEYRDYVKAFTPERGEQITGVPAEQIREAARMYAENTPSAIQTSASPVVHNINGVQNYRAIFSLIALTGNYDVAGGNRVKSFASVPMNEYDQIRRYDGEEAIGEKECPVWYELPCEEAQATRLADHILQEDPYPIHAVLSFGMNHRMWPQPKWMTEALKKLDFFVDADIFLTDTGRYADLLLPVCSSFERDEVYTKGKTCYLAEKAIEPLGESKNDIEIIMELAKCLDIQDEVLQKDYEDYMDYLIEPSGVHIDELRGNRQGIQAKNIREPLEKTYLNHPFATKSGKIELYSLLLEPYADRHGYDPLPVYHDYREEHKEEMEQYPLILNTGSRKPHLFHARMYRSSWIRQLEDLPMVEIHPQDGERYGIEDGDEILLKTPVGETMGRAFYNVSGLPGVVHTYHGNREADVNDLISLEYLDPISGFPGYKSYYCRIEKV
jgi:anaerobic selenocysteine-containing dehydrogenase